MITKLVLSGSFDFDDVAVALVPFHRHGVDAGFFTKRASEAGVFAKEIEKLASEGGMKDHTILHVLAVGDSERYGDNRNHDAFSREDNKTAHTRFKSQGHVFKNHRNSSPTLKTGSVVATAHNNVMSRIELLIALENAKYAEELDEFAKGGDIPVSMGSLQKYDVCSACGNKAPTAKQHCDHIKHQLGEILADGTKVAMLNPDPGYFDISTVFKPADRIGYSLRKVASAGEVGGHDLATIYGLGQSGCKKAMLIRLAEMEKHTPAVGKIMGPKDLPEHVVTSLKKAASAYSVGGVLSALHEGHHLLSFNDFMSVVVGESKYAGVADTQVPFSELDENSEVESLDGDPSNMPTIHDEDLHEATSMEASPVVHRSMSSIILPQSLAKAASADPVKDSGCSLLYAYYKLAFVSHPANAERPDVVRAISLTTRPLRT